MERTLPPVGAYRSLQCFTGEAEADIVHALAPIFLRKRQPRGCPSGPPCVPSTHSMGSCRRSKCLMTGMTSLRPKSRTVFCASSCSPEIEKSMSGYIVRNSFRSSRREPNRPGEVGPLALGLMPPKTKIRRACRRAGLSTGEHPLHDLFPQSHSPQLI